MLSLNARSIVNKTDSLELLLLSYDPHLVVLTETWLHEGIRDDEIIPPGYQLLRRDRGSRGGGVAVIAKSHINVTLLDQFDDHESLFLNISLWGFTVLLCAVYRPPNAADLFLDNLYDHLLAQHAQNVIVTGDFNLSAIDWNQLAYGMSNCSDRILDIMLALNLDQIVCEHTRENALLDLFFVSQMFLTGVLSVEPGISDHRLLSFCWTARHVGSTWNRSVVNVKDYERANDIDIIDYLDDKLSINSEQSVSGLWKHFKEAIKFSFEHCPFEESTK